MRASFFVVALFFCHAALGQEAFQVNVHTALSQRDPALAMDAGGRFVVVWTSTGQDGEAEGVYARLFDEQGAPAGGEIPVNDTPRLGQYQPAVAMDGRGRFVVVYTSHTDSSMLDVYGRLFDPDGRTTGAAFRVNTTLPLSQAAPDVAMDADGNFVVVWHSWDQDGGDRGVYGRRFAADGTPLGEEFLVNTVTAYSQAYPAVAMAPEGGFAVAWDTWKEDAPEVWSYDVHARLFDADGAPHGDDFQVNTYAANNQWHADVAMEAGGAFVVAWTSWGQDGDEGGVYAQRFHADGTPRGAEMQVNETTTAYQWLPAVSMDGRGGFLVVWSSWLQDGDREGIYYRYFDAGGRAQGAERPLNAYTRGYQWEPAASWQGEHVLVAWSSWGQDGDDYGVFARRFASTAVDVETAPARPSASVVLQHYPNPLSSSTRIEFTLTEPGFAILNVYDMLGRRVGELVSEEMLPGTHTAVFDAEGLPAGTYLYVLQYNGLRLSGKMLLVK